MQRRKSLIIRLRCRYGAAISIGIMTVILLAAACVITADQNEITSDRGQESARAVDDSSHDRKDTTGKDSRERDPFTDPFTFSEDSGFYDRDLEINVSMAQKGAIYYTGDGSEPGPDNENSYLYEEPIVIFMSGQTEAHTYRFRAYYEDGTKSRVVSNTYYVGPDVKERFDVPVISVSGDPDDFYGYENGIFVEGKLRDDYEAEHPGEEPQYDWPANYNVRGRESERRAGIEFFLPDGLRLFSQNGGIRISGNFTRQSEQKSFKLYARQEYDPSLDNKLKYAFFPDNVSTVDGAIIDEYEVLKVRNTGNDRSEAYIRDELAMRLSAQAGFKDVQYVRPVSVTMNNEYQGLYWIHSDYDDEYFKEKYGSYDGEMAVIGDGETVKVIDTNDELVNQAAKEYQEIYDRFSALDLTDDENYQELNGLIDLDNYIFYFALEIYMANRDWPFNNERAYRYVSPDDTYQEGTVFDGRYRYLLYDVDTSMGHGTVSETINESESFDILSKIYENGYAPLFTALMERPDCRMRFMQNILRLANGSFSPANVSDVLAEMHDEREQEMDAYVEMSIENPDIPEISPYYTDMQMECIRTWSAVTCGNLVDNLNQLWQFGTPYRLRLSLDGVSGALVNGLEVNEDRFPEGFEGTYLTGCDTIVNAVTAEGRRFVCWKVGDQKYYEESLFLTPDMLPAGEDPILSVELVTEDDPDQGLIIDRIETTPEGEIIYLSNPTLHDISTFGYYLSDRDKNKPSHMNYLPSSNLARGGVLRIDCRGTIPTSDTFLQLNFGLKKGETLTLGHSATTQAIKVEIPDLQKTGTVYSRDVFTGRWVETRK